MEGSFDRFDHSRMKSSRQRWWFAELGPKVTFRSRRHSKFLNRWQTPFVEVEFRKLYPLKGLPVIITEFIKHYIIGYGPTISMKLYLWLSDPKSRQTIVHDDSCITRFKVSFNYSIRIIGRKQQEHAFSTVCSSSQPRF